MTTRPGHERPSARLPLLGDVLGPLAAAVLRAVIARGAASVAEVTGDLRRQQDRALAYTTVMTVMGRLCERGVLNRELRGRQYIYRASATEQQLVDRLSAAAVERLVERYGAAALRQFAIKLADLDPDIRHRLDLLAEEPE